MRSGLVFPRSQSQDDESMYASPLEKRRKKGEPLGEGTQLRGGLSGSSEIQKVGLIVASLSCKLLATAEEGPILDGYL